MSLKRSHVLYLQSKHRTTGTTSQYTITLPDFIQSDPNQELFRITLVAFTAYNEFLQIREGRDTITINNVAYNIPWGTYTYQKLARVITTVTNEQTIWNSEIHAMSFLFNTTKTVAFDDIANVLGFDAGISYTGTKITSVRAMNPIEPSHIMVHLNNVSVIDDHLNLSNHTGEIRVSNVLGKVLINGSPFQMVFYTQVLENDGLYTSDNTLQTLEFILTDNDGRILTDMAEHEMVLRIESQDIDNYDMRTMINEIKEIKQTVKDLFLYRALRFR